MVDCKIVVRLCVAARDGLEYARAVASNLSWKNFSMHFAWLKKVGHNASGKRAATCPQMLWISMCKVCTKLA